MGLGKSERFAAWLQADHEAQIAGQKLLRHQSEARNQLTMAEHAEVSRLRARAATLYEEATREFEQEIQRREREND
jgi:hypothetical protein